MCQVPLPETPVAESITDQAGVSDDDFGPIEAEDLPVIPSQTITEPSPAPAATEPSFQPQNPVVTAPSGGLSLKLGPIFLS